MAMAVSVSVRVTLAVVSVVPVIATAPVSVRHHHDAKKLRQGSSWGYSKSSWLRCPRKSASACDALPHRTSRRPQPGCTQPRAQRYITRARKLFDLIESVQRKPF
jgi:hypothetical protein